MPTPRSGAYCFGALLVYALGVFVFAAFASYPVHGLLELFGARPAFPEVVSRTLKLAALVGLVPLLTACAMRDARAFGFAPAGAAGAPGTGRLDGLVPGFVAGVAMMAVLVAVLFALGVRELAPERIAAAGGVAWILTRACIIAALVATLEEIWFRGVLHALLERIGGPVTAVAVGAVLYAGVHFVRYDGPDPGAPDWGTGLDVLAGSFGRFAQGHAIGPMVALVAGGVLLGIVRARRARVGACIGIHAGWVVVIQSVNKSSDFHSGAQWAFLVGHFDGVVGYMAAVWFAVLAMAYLVRMRWSLRP